MVNLKSKAFSLLLIQILLFLLIETHCTHERNHDSTALETRFKSWMKHHARHYKDKEEYMLRFGIYQAHMNFIDYVNSQNLSYKLGDNEFADITNDEFKAFYVGRLIIPQSNNHNSTLPKLRLQQQAPTPAAVDWRKKGAVNSIKMQGRCGSCWSFCATAGVESLIQIKTGKLLSLSEQELVDCDTAKSKGCSGGYKNEAFEYIQTKGVSLEKEYPYTGTQGLCKAPAKKAAKISGYKTVAANSEATLMEAVAKQPVSISVEGSGNDFQMYKSGIFMGNCGTKVDHELAIVGYGEEGGQKYWIMRNSWGTNWGEAGYMRILRGGPRVQGICGLAMWPSYPVA